MNKLDWVGFVLGVGLLLLAAYAVTVKPDPLTIPSLILAVIGAYVALPSSLMSILGQITKILHPENTRERGHNDTTY